MSPPPGPTPRRPLWARRAVIATLGVGVPAALGLGWALRRPDSTAFAARMLALRAPYVQLEAEQRERFIADYLAAHGHRMRRALAAVRVPGLYGSRWLTLVTSAGDREVITATERHFVTLLLMSTGFFEATPPGSGRLRYDGLQPVCANRFAKRLSDP